MQIDARIEEYVREAYRGVAAEDGDRMVAAFEGLSQQDAARVLGYGLFVVGYILREVLRKGPTEEDFDVIAGRAIETVSSWIDLGPKNELVALMRAASKGEMKICGVPGDDLVGFIFVLGGYLLQVYRLPNQHWYEYLDEIWSHAQAIPEPSSTEI
jgi:hypothetical protein